MKTLILATTISATLALAACGPREDPDRSPPQPTTAQQSASQPAGAAPGASTGQQTPAAQPQAGSDPTTMNARAERERQLENAIRACGELPADVRGDCEDDARRAADIDVNADAEDDDTRAGSGRPAPPPRANGD